MSSYAEDRAAIENLMARYMFALDWQDADEYASTFVSDGILDWAGGIIQGRESIRTECRTMREYFLRLATAHAPKRRPRMRHFITNIVLEIDGDQAAGRAYWFELDNDTRNRWPYAGGYGHYEDRLRKVDGRWLFSHRKIFNECMDDRAAVDANPVHPEAMSLSA